MKRAVAVGLAASLLASGSAYGFWTTSGSGTGTSSVATAAPLTLAPGSASSRVYPGGSADVAVGITNPNSFPVHIGALSLDGSQGTGGFGVDGAHSGCGVGVLSFAAQTNAGDGWTVPAGGALNLHLPGSLSMTTAAANACQGATFTVYLAAAVDAYTLIRRTAGLVSLWRLGSSPLASDNFTGSTSFASGVVTPANRLRRSSAPLLPSVAVAPANYAVMADVVPVTLIAGDALGVAARINGTSYYAARYQTSDTTWRLVRVINGVETSLGSSAATLTPGVTYRVRLDVSGTSLGLAVNGTTLLTATDAAISSGRAGLALGVTGSPAVSDATGLQADNFRVYPYDTSAPDVVGGNTGVYQGTVVRNEPGALAGDLNGSVTLDGVAGAMAVAAPTGLPVGAGPRSVELWFKRTGTGTAALFAYGSQSSGRLFAGRLTSATGLRLDAFSAVRDWTLPYGTSDGAWHHVAIAYDGGTVQAYLDGTALGAQSLVLNTTLDSSGFTAGTFAGSLDEIALYSVALTAATVLDHYRAGHGS